MLKFESAFDKALEGVELLKQKFQDILEGIELNKMENPAEYIRN
jgi:hypothetical protein